jgi:hypothetical protein
MSRYQAILNVSDYPAYGLNLENCNVQWCPIEEWAPWGYAPFYWAVNMLDYYTSNKQNDIYVHCYAGKHRSPMIVYLYLQSLGYSEAEAFAKFHTIWQVKFDNEPKDIPTGNWLKTFYDKDVARGRIPGDVIEFMKKVRENPEKSALQILDLMKNRTEDISDKDFHITMKEAVKDGEKCPHCHNGLTYNDDEPGRGPCRKCNGTGKKL